MIYLDTAALVKLVRRDPASDELADWLDERRGTIAVRLQQDLESYGALV
jgi:uncharacterized protein